MTSILEQRQRKLQASQAINEEKYIEFFGRQEPVRSENTPFHSLVESVSEVAGDKYPEATHFIYSREAKHPNTDPIDCITLFTRPELNPEFAVGKILTNTTRETPQQRPIIDKTANSRSTIRVPFSGGLVKVLSEGDGLDGKFNKVKVIFGASELNGGEFFVLRSYIQRLKNTKPSLPLAIGTCFKEYNEISFNQICSSFDSPWYNSKKPIFVSKKCEYWINIRTNLDISAYSLTEDTASNKQVILQGIEEAFDYYSKTEDIRIKPIVTEQCYMFAKVKALYPAPTGTSVLISIPAVYFDAIPQDSRTLSEYLQDFRGQVDEMIRFKTSEVNEKVNKISSYMLSFNQDSDYIKSFGKISGPVGYGSFSFNTEVKNLQSFIASVASFFKTNNTIFRRTHPDLVEIGLNSDRRVLFVLLTKDSTTVQLPVAINNFSQLETSRNLRTINYMLQLDAIDNKLDKKQIRDYKQFIEEHVEPEPTIAENSGECIPHPLVPMKCCLENAFKNLYGEVSTLEFFGNTAQDAFAGLFDGYIDFVKYSAKASCGRQVKDIFPPIPESLTGEENLEEWYKDFEVFSGLNTLTGSNGSFNSYIENTRNNLTGSYNKLIEHLSSHPNAPANTEEALQDRSDKFNRIAPLLWECARNDSQLIDDPYIRDFIEKVTGNLVGDNIEGADTTPDIGIEDVTDWFESIPWKSLIKKALDCTCKLLERSGERANRDIARSRREDLLRQQGLGSYIDNSRTLEEEFGEKTREYLNFKDPRRSDTVFDQERESISNTNNRYTSTELQESEDVPPIMAEALSFVVDAVPGEYAAFAHEAICKDICVAAPILCSCLDFSLPELPTIPLLDGFQVRGIFGYIIELLLEVLLDLLIDIILGFIISVIEDLLRCEFENNPNLAESFNSVLDSAYSLSGFDTEFAENFDVTGELLPPFLSDVPLVVSPGEFCDLMRGQPLDRTLNTLMDLILSQHQGLAAYLSTKESIKNLFAQLGSRVEVGQICRQISSISTNIPNISIAESICDRTGNSNIRQLLEDGGASDNQISDYLQEARDCRGKRIISIARLSQGIASNPETIFSDLLPNIIAAPGEEGIIPRDPPELRKMVSKVMDNMFSPVAIAFDRESNSFNRTLVYEDTKNKEVELTIGDNVVTIEVPSTDEDIKIIAGGLKDDLEREELFYHTGQPIGDNATTFKLTIPQTGVRTKNRTSLPSLYGNLTFDDYRELQYSGEIYYSLPYSYKCLSDERQRDLYEIRISEAGQLTTDNFKLVSENYIPDFVKHEMSPQLNGSFSDFQAQGRSSLQQELFSYSVDRRIKDKISFYLNNTSLLLLPILSEPNRTYFEQELFNDVTIETIQRFLRRYQESDFFDIDKLAGLKLKGDGTCDPPLDSIMNIDTISGLAKDRYLKNRLTDDHSERFAMSSIEGAVYTYVRANILEFILSGIFAFSTFNIKDLADDSFSRVATMNLLQALDLEGDFKLKGKILEESFASYKKLIKATGTNNLNHVGMLNRWNPTFKSEFLRWCKLSMLSRIESGEQFIDPLTDEKVKIVFDRDFVNESVNDQTGISTTKLITEYYFKLKEWYEGYIVYENLLAGSDEDLDTLQERSRQGVKQINDTLVDFEINKLTRDRGGPFRSVGIIGGITLDERLQNTRRFERSRRNFFMTIEDLLKSLIAGDPDNKSPENISKLLDMARGDRNILWLEVLTTFDSSEQRYNLNVEDYAGPNENVNILDLVNWGGPRIDQPQFNKQSAENLLAFFSQVNSQDSCECIYLTRTLEGISQEGKEANGTRALGYLEFLVREQIESTRFDIESFISPKIGTFDSILFGENISVNDIVPSALYSSDSSYAELQGINFVVASPGERDDRFLPYTEAINKERPPFLIERIMTIKEKPLHFWNTLVTYSQGTGEPPEEMTDLTRDQADKIVNLFHPVNRQSATRAFEPREKIYNKEYVCSFKGFHEWLSTIDYYGLVDDGIESFVWSMSIGGGNFYFNYKNFFDTIKIGTRIVLIDDNMPSYGISQEEKAIIFNNEKSYFGSGGYEGINTIPFAYSLHEMGSRDIVARPERPTISELQEYYGLTDEDIISNNMVTYREGLSYPPFLSYYNAVGIEQEDYNQYRYFFPSLNFKPIEYFKNNVKPEGIDRISNMIVTIDNSGRRSDLGESISSFLSSKEDFSYFTLLDSEEGQFSQENAPAEKYEVLLRGFLESRGIGSNLQWDFGNIIEKRKKVKEAIIGQYGDRGSIIIESLYRDSLLVDTFVKSLGTAPEKLSYRKAKNKTSTGYDLNSVADLPSEINMANRNRRASTVQSDLVSLRPNDEPSFYLTYHKEWNSITGDQTPSPQIMSNNFTNSSLFSFFNDINILKTDNDATISKSSWELTNQVYFEDFIRQSSSYEGEIGELMISWMLRSFDKHIQPPAHDSIWNIVGSFRPKIKFIWKSNGDSNPSDPYITRGTARWGQIIDFSGAIEGTFVGEVDPRQNGAILAIFDWDWSPNLQAVQSFQSTRVDLIPVYGPRLLGTEFYDTLETSVTQYQIQNSEKFQELRKKMIFTMDAIQSIFSISPDVPDLDTLFSGMSVEWELKYEKQILTNLRKQREYKLLTEFFFPTKRLASLTGLYTMQKTGKILEASESFVETKYNAKLLFYISLLNFTTDENGRAAWWQNDMNSIANLLEPKPWWMDILQTDISFSLSEFLTFIPKKIFSIMLDLPLFAAILDPLCYTLSLGSNNCRQLISKLDKLPELWERDPDPLESNCGTTEQIQNRINRRNLLSKTDGIQDKPFEYE